MRFIVGLLFGIALGVGAALMLAPQSRSDMRRVLQVRVGQGEDEGDEDETIEAKDE